MGLTVYWYPTADGPLRKLEGARNPVELQQSRGTATAWSQSGGGLPYRVRSTMTYRVLVRYVFPGADHVAEAQEWDALVSHLEEGGYCGVARTADRAWAGLTTGATSAGDTALTTGGNAFSAWAASATLSSSYPVRLESGPAGGDIQEMCAVSSYSAPVVTLSTAARRTYPGHVLVRDPDFWPVCYLDAAAGDGFRLGTSNRRLTWTVEGVLTYSPALAMALAAGGSVDGPDVGGRLVPDLSGALPNLASDTAPQWGVEGGGSGLSIESAYRQIRRPTVTRPRGVFGRVRV